MVEDINIWELGERINIRVNQEFLNIINHEIKRVFVTKANAHAALSLYHSLPIKVFCQNLKSSYKYYIDLEIFLGLCTILNISRYELQRNIIAYKLRRSHNYISSPRLPIRISPIFDMLIAHHIGDGNVVDPKRNRRPYFSYRQFNQQNMHLYQKKLE